jgi:hypothetical protein
MPMLADDLIAAVGGVDDMLYRGAFTAMAVTVRDAQRFDLSPEVMRSAWTISHSPIGPQLRALPLCKLPFQLAWFEWPAGFMGIPTERKDIYAPVPKRMGALVSTDESLQRGSISYAWLHPHQGVNICPLSITFDWRTDAEPVADLTNASHWHEKATDDQWTELMKYPRMSGSSREDVIADNQRFGLVINPTMKAFVDAAAQSHNPEGVKLLMNAATKDIEGEAPMLRAAIMLLNSRNLAEYEPRPTPPKLNAARARRGKAPLLDYTHVRVRLSRGLAARAGMAADARNPSRLHLVRGHFKIRASGVFWWSPFARGATDARTPIKRQQRTVSL